MDKIIFIFVFFIIGILSVFGSLMGGFFGDYFEVWWRGGRVILIGVVIFIGMLVLIGIIFYLFFF